MQNLKHFECYQIEDQEFLILARAAPALESLETKYFDVTRFPEGDIFPNISKFKARYFGQDMQEPTGDGHFAALVREEMRENPERFWSADDLVTQNESNLLSS